MRKLLPILFLIPAIASAQWPASWPLDSGSKVRILSPVVGDQFQIGTLISTRADTVLFRPAGNLTPFTVTTSHIVKLDVARGSHQQKAKGALIGLLAGAAGGALFGIAAYPNPCTDFCFLNRGETAAIMGGLGGVAGALIGALVGGFVLADTWVPVAVPHS